MSNEINTPARRARVHAERDEVNGQFYAMTHEDRQAFNLFRAKIRADFAPDGFREQWLANSIAEDMWRLDRARGEENNIYALSYSGEIGDSLTADSPEVHTAACQARTWLAEGKHLQALSLYESRLRRNIEKAQKELRELQSERKALYAQALEEAKLLAQLAEYEGQTLNPDEVVEHNGFAFSNREILAIIRREQRLAMARSLARQKAKAA
jgi:hypothetical protein